MKTKLILIAVLATINTTARADCYMRSATVGQADGKLEQVADTKKWVVPYTNGQKKCIVSFRGFAKNDWWNGSGEYVYSTAMAEDQACKVALEQGKKLLVEQIFGKKVINEEQMICSDMPSIRTRPVKVGDVIQLSEVQPHPDKKEPFGYNGAECRFFIETDVGYRLTELYTYQGVVCNIRRGEWQVIDKW